MDLKKDSWYVWLYCSTYSVDKNHLPISRCVFFERLIAALLLFPMLWIGHLIAFINNRKNPNDIRTFHLGWLSLVLISLLSFAATEDSKKHHTLLQYYGIGLLLLIFFIIIALVTWWIIMQIVTLHEKYSEYKKLKIKNKVFLKVTPKEPRKYLLIEYIKGKRDKYCGKINWK